MIDRPAISSAALAVVLLAAVLGPGCASAPPPRHSARGGSSAAPRAGAFRGPLRELVFDGSTAVRPRRSAAASEPGDPVALWRRARALRAERRWDESLRAAASAVVTAPEQPEGYAELAATLLRARQRDRAEAAFRTALRLDPGRFETRHDLAMLLWSAGRRAEAEDEWRRVAAASPGHGRSLARLAVAAWFAGAREEASEWLTAATAAGAAVPVQLLDLAEPAVRAVSAPTTLELVVEPPVRLDPGGGAHQSAEPSVAAVRRDEGERLVAGWIDTRQQDDGGEWRIAFAVSDDGGRTWSADEVLPPPIRRSSPTRGAARYGWGR